MGCRGHRRKGRLVRPKKKKGAASGYKLIIGILAFIVCAFLWIPLDWGMDQATTALNSGITDADTIERNNIANNAFYFTLFIILVAIVIYIVKPSKGETEQGEVVYAPAYG